MRPGSNVRPEPVIDNTLGLLGRREPFRIENLSPQSPIEPLVAPVLPGRPRRDPDRLNPNASKPGLYRPCCERGAVIGSDVLWGTVAQQEQIGYFENIFGPHLGANHNSQGLPRQANHPARPPLRRRMLLACVNDGLTKLICGQALGFRWFRLSLRMSFSNSSSATIFVSRAFSFSRRFI